MLQNVRQSLSSLRSPLAVSLCGLTAACAIGAITFHILAIEDKASRARLAAQTHSALVQLHQLRQQDAVRAALSSPVLPGAERVGAFSTDLHAAAGKHNVAVLGADLAEQPSAANAMAGTAIRVTARGGYPAVKRMIGEVLALHANVALGAVSLRRARPENNDLEIELNFTFFHRDPK